MAVAIMKNTYDMLLEKIDSIKAELRTNSDLLQKAADFGDLKENQEYKTAKENQERLFNKLSRFDEYLNCDVIDGNNVKSDVVSFGTSVKAEEVESGKKRIYNIVGPVEYELESMENVVTNTSPLAKQIMGKKKGEVVEVRLPRGVETIKILEIKPII
jgi:transcription elongation factor GreA